MKKKRIVPAAIAVLCLALSANPVQAETIGLRFSYGPTALDGDDINSWIRATNALWAVWTERTGGRMEGGFSELTFDPGFEGELSFRILRGLSFRLGGGRLQSRAQGTVFLSGAAEGHSETHILSNRLSAAYAKLGLVFSHPVIGNLSAHIGGGRHLAFVKYESRENYEARFTFLGREYVYWYSKDNTFRSEALGAYALFGLEYTVFNHIGLVVDVENVWSKVDGFKGPFSYTRMGPEDETVFQEKGRASLYFYETRPAGLDTHYPVLSGHKDRPEGDAFRGVRQGVFDFSGMSVRFGLRLKF